MLKNTFITVTWNNEEEIGNLIESIQCYEKTSQIIVVDNNSSDDSVAVAKSYSNVKVIKLKSNLGFAKANNIAFKYVKSEFVTFINPDTVLNQSLIANLVQELSNNSRIGLVGVALENSDGSRQPSIFKFQRPLSIYIEQFNIGKVLPNFLRKSLSPENLVNPSKMIVDWIMGAFMFTKSSYYRQVGGFSEKYFMYAEDMDLCYKYHQVGLDTLFNPSFSVTHVGGVSEKNSDGEKSIKLLSSFCIFAKQYHFDSNIQALFNSYRIKYDISKVLNLKRTKRYYNNLRFLKEKL